MNIDHFIQQQKARGALDSSGNFSVNPFKAREKMAAFQTQDPNFYLLRFVQAGVALRSKSISIRLGWESVVVRFEEPALDSFSLEEVQSGFGRAYAKASGDALSFFLNGVHSLMAQAPNRLLLRWCYGEGQARRLMVSEHGMEVLEEREAPARCDFSLEVERKVKRTRVMDEIRALYGRCGCCPVPILVDGTPVNTRHNPTSSLFDGDYPSTVSGYLPNRFVFAERYFAVGQGDGLLLPDPNEREAQIKEIEHREDGGSPQADVFLLQASAGSHDALIRVSSHLQEQARLTYVQAGVEISTEVLPFDSLQAFVCVDGMQTDLSGTQLMKDERYHELRRRVLSEMKVLVGGLRGHLGSLKPRFDWTPERKFSAALMSVFAVFYLGSGVALWSVPVMGKAWAAGMAAFTGYSGSEVLKAKDNLDSELRQTVDCRLESSWIALIEELNKEKC